MSTCTDEVSLLPTSFIIQYWIRFFFQYVAIFLPINFSSICWECFSMFDMKYVFLFEDLSVPLNMPERPRRSLVRNYIQFLFMEDFIIMISAQRRSLLDKISPKVHQTGRSCAVRIHPVPATLARSSLHVAGLPNRHNIFQILSKCGTIWD